MTQPQPQGKIDRTFRWGPYLGRISLGVGVAALLFNVAAAHPTVFCILPLLSFTAMALGAAGLNLEARLTRQSALWGAVLGFVSLALFLVINTFVIGL